MINFFISFNLICKDCWLDLRLTFIECLSSGRHAHCDPETTLQHCTKVQAHRDHWWRYDHRQHGGARVRPFPVFSFRLSMLFPHYALCTTRPKAKDTQDKPLPPETFRQVHIKIISPIFHSDLFQQWFISVQVCATNSMAFLSR